MDQTKVFLYTLSTCGHCKNIKKLLEENNIKYESADVDMAKRDEQIRLMAEMDKVSSSMSFPTLVIGDKVIVGFREAEIREALGL